MVEQSETKGKILIVDDERDILITLSKYLTDEGFEVKTLNNSRDTLNLIKEKSWIPDLILLDIALPEMSGLELLKHIKEELPKMNVIMITAYRDAEKVVEAFRLGAYDCIFKPFDLKYLRKAIKAKLLE